MSRRRSSSVARSAETKRLANLGTLLPTPERRAAAVAGLIERTAAMEHELRDAELAIVGRGMPWGACPDWLARNVGEVIANRLSLVESACVELLDLARELDASASAVGFGDPGSYQADAYEAAVARIRTALGAAGPIAGPTSEEREAEAYQRGYDDGCDDPASMWTSTKMAVEEAARVDERAKANAAVERAVAFFKRYSYSEGNLRRLCLAPTDAYEAAVANRASHD